MFGHSLELKTGSVNPILSEGLYRREGNLLPSALVHFTLRRLVVASRLHWREIWLACTLDHPVVFGVLTTDVSANPL